MIEIINSLTNKPYTPEVADHVCRYFSWIKINKFPTSKEKMGGEENLTHDPEMTFLNHSILRAEFAFCGLGINYKFVEGLVKEWDNIEKLFNVWPLHTIKYSVTHKLGDGQEPYIYHGTETFRKFSKVEPKNYIPRGGVLVSHTIK